MEQRISVITLGVNDLKRSRAFYDSLGWEAASEDDADQIVAYDLMNMTLCLFPLEKLAEDVTVRIEQKEYSTITLAYNVRGEEEVDNTLKDAVKAGGRIVKEGQKVFWGGYSGYFADPDGNLWEVAYNPFAPLGPKGEFKWKGYE